MSYLSKDSSVESQRLKVQRLSIPFIIVGNATAASVSISSDLPNVMKVQTSGKDQISAQLTANSDSVTFNTAASDASGIFRVYMNMGENCQKLVSARVEVIDGSGATCSVKRGDADGLSSLGRPVLVCDCSLDLSTAVTLDATLHIDYIGE